MLKVRHSAGVCVALSDSSADVPVTHNQESKLPIFKQTR